jgi:methylated-DNA-protein-cysteine methyltransferase-like protein
MKVTYEEIHRIVCRIPRGCVATYGQIAELAGIPNQARRVGYALSALPKGTLVPWQRVVNAKGEISVRAKAGAETTQHKMLRAEGIVFDKEGKIPMQRYQWRPRA